MQQDELRRLIPRQPADRPGTHLTAHDGAHLDSRTEIGAQW